MRSLYARLTLIFLLVLLLAGSIILWVAHRNNYRHFLEFTQRLNQPIAMYMAENANFSINDELNAEALASLAPHVMMINPSVEVYLLDAEGRVANHSLRVEDLQRDRVSLEPIRRFLTDDAVFPLLGDDPKNSRGQHIFSAHPLKNNDQIVGYVYAVLSADNQQTLLASVTSSYSFKNLAISLSTILLLTLLTGSLLFYLQTRRLRSLHTRVRQWQQDHGLPALQQQPRQRFSHDELDELHTAYEAMAGELLSQYQLLEHGDQVRRELFANISHDLRTPLTTLHGYLETILLKGDLLSASERERYIAVAYKHSGRLRTLVAQLFQLSKLNSGEYALHTESFSLLELAHDSVLDFTLQANEKSIGLTIQPADDPKQKFNVQADIELIHRVFENLIGNALSYTPPEGRVEVRLRLPSAAHDIEVTISDTGKGIDEAAMGRDLFKRHTRGDTTPDGMDHAGLGLAIVRSILTLHNSDIHVFNTKAGGCCFSFRLPAAASHPQRIAAWPSTSQSGRTD